MYKENVLRSALASKLAYIETPMLAKVPITKQLHGNMCTRTKIVENTTTGAHAYLWKSGKDSAIISFRGSHDMNDILRFVSFSKKKINIKDDSILVHKGIYEVFESIEGELSNILLSLPTLDPRSITFCGHSMGGALAMFAAAYYASLTSENTYIACHTFGAPMVGDKSFVDWHNKYVDESFNIINPNDPVRLLPIIGGYCHTQQIIIPSEKNIGFLAAHDLDTYYDILNSLCRKRP